MALQLEIAQLGSEVIRQVALEVDDISSEETQTLIDDMLATVAEAQGVGIAAPQVYQSKPCGPHSL